jgi:heptosyltransferase-2
MHSPSARSQACAFSIGNKAGERSMRFDQLIAPVLQPPFANSIPLDLAPVKGKSPMSLLWRRLRPAASLAMRLQFPLQRQYVDRNLRRVLWIYKGSPQVGDSLMDLSSRVLLAAQGIKVDLCTDPHLVNLYQADDVFGHVFSDASQIAADTYDLVILDSFKWRCLEDKFKFLLRIPFVTMRGYFSGPEFNRTLFSFCRMNQLLDAGLSETELHARARPHLAGSDTDRDTAAHLPLPAGTIALAIGGASAGRTYPHWDKVVAALLQQHHDARFVLLGSSNAVAMRDAIFRATGESAANIIDCVDHCTLTQTYEILRRCTLAASADGGLLHVANAAGIPTVSLFDCHIAPALRLTAANRSIALQSKGTIDGIPVEEVAHCIERAMAREGIWQ